MPHSAAYQFMSLFVDESDLVDEFDAETTDKRQAELKYSGDKLAYIGGLSPVMTRKEESKAKEPFVKKLFGLGWSKNAISKETGLSPWKVNRIVSG